MIKLEFEQYFYSGIGESSRADLSDTVHKVELLYVAAIEES